MKDNLLLTFLLLAFVFNSCSSEDDKEQNYIAVPESPVRMDLSVVPYPKLSDYHFFEGVIASQNPVYGLIPFQPASELFSDYAKKKRFVWMPKNAKAIYNGDHEILELPVGAALVKSFYYNNVQPDNTTKIIETRVMIRKSTGWIFAKYVWNDEQTEAFLQIQGSTVPVTWIDGENISHSIEYEIPSEFNCITCHTINEVLPIGIKPQNLNTDYIFADGTKNQLSKWIEMGYLENTVPSVINSVVDYNDASQNLDLRVRSYFDSNCAHCHVDGGNADYVSLRFKFDVTTNPENMGVCVSANTIVPGIDHGQLVMPNNTSQSLLYYMLNTNNTFYMMPRIGRTVIHSEGIDLVGQWINTLEECD